MPAGVRAGASSSPLADAVSSFEQSYVRMLAGLVATTGTAKAESAGAGGGGDGIRYAKQEQCELDLDEAMWVVMKAWGRVVEKQRRYFSTMLGLTSSFIKKQPAAN